ncbi:hypothetical protein ACQP1W_47335 [Spirillospora sp. CA-255316]
MTQVLDFGDKIGSIVSAVLAAASFVVAVLALKQQRAIATEGEMQQTRDTEHSNTQTGTALSIALWTSLYLHWIAWLPIFFGVYNEWGGWGSFFIVALANALIGALISIAGFYVEDWIQRILLLGFGIISDTIILLIFAQRLGSTFRFGGFGTLSE